MKAMVDLLEKGGFMDKDNDHGMKGGDLSNQLAQSYRKAKRYKKIFFSLLDMTVVSSLAVHKVLGGEMERATFRLEIVQGLLQEGERRGRRNHLAPCSCGPCHSCSC